MAQLANTQKKTLEKNILNVTTVKLFSFKKFNVLCLFEKWIATPQRFWPYCILFQILRHILSHENSFVDCMTWRRKDVSLSPLRWQFFCLVMCIAKCNNENKKNLWKIAIFYSKTDKYSNVLKLFSLKQKTSTST